MASSQAVEQMLTEAGSNWGNVTEELVSTENQTVTVSASTHFALSQHSHLSNRSVKSSLAN